jgi:hypothetical protein
MAKQLLGNHNYHMQKDVTIFTCNNHVDHMYEDVHQYEQISDASCLSVHYYKQTNVSPAL